MVVGRGACRQHPLQGNREPPAMGPPQSALHQRDRSRILGRGEGVERRPVREISAAWARAASTQSASDSPYPSSWEATPGRLAIALCMLSWLGVTVAAYPVAF